MTLAKEQTELFPQTNAFQKSPTKNTPSILEILATSIGLNLSAPNKQKRYNLQSMKKQFRQNLQARLKQENLSETNKKAYQLFLENIDTFFNPNNEIAQNPLLPQTEIYSSRPQKVILRRKSAIISGNQKHR